MSTEPSLPANVLDRGLALAEGATFMGKPMKELPPQELLAVAALGWDAYYRHLEQSIKQNNILFPGAVS